MEKELIINNCCEKKITHDDSRKEAQDIRSNTVSTIKLVEILGVIQKKYKNDSFYLIDKGHPDTYIVDGVSMTGRLGMLGSKRVLPVIKNELKDKTNDKKEIITCSYVHMVGDSWYTIATIKDGDKTMMVHLQDGNIMYNIDGQKVENCFESFYDKDGNFYAVVEIDDNSLEKFVYFSLAFINDILHFRIPVNLNNKYKPPSGSVLPVVKGKIQYDIMGEKINKFSHLKYRNSEIYGFLHVNKDIKLPVVHGYIMRDKNGYNIYNSDDIYVDDENVYMKVTIDPEMKRYVLYLNDDMIVNMKDPLTDNNLDIFDCKNVSIIDGQIYGDFKFRGTRYLPVVGGTIFRVYQNDYVIGCNNTKYLKGKVLGELNLASKGLIKITE